MNADLTRRLHQLGIDYESIGALLLFPLVEVAWADGRMQPAEATRIAAVAQEWDLSEEAMVMVRGWLRYPPSTAYGQRVRDILARLLADGVPFQGPWDAETILREAKAVATVAGSWLPFWRVTDAERQVIDMLKRQLETKERPDATAQGHPDLDRRINQVTLDFDRSRFTDSVRGVIIPDFEQNMRFDVTGLGFTVGASKDADLCIVDSGLEPIHCRFTARGDWHYLEELAGETRVNGERIRARRLLGGETIRLAPLCSFAFKRVRQVDPVQSRV
ncbi:MAG: FHA domain-containing protein [Myxococcota bacterium]